MKAIAEGTETARLEGFKNRNSRRVLADERSELKGAERTENSVEVYEQTAGKLSSENIPVKK